MHPHPPTATPPALRTISHAELMQLPVLRYAGPVHVVSNQSELPAAVLAISRERVVGFDIESRPTFRKGQVHLPSLVQIAGSRAVYLFQLRHLDCASLFADVLGNPHVIKTGVAPGRDIIDLQRLTPFTPANVIDLATVATSHGFGKTGMRNLAGILLGGRITKGAQTSNWARPHLSPAQIQYAATDAWACRELYLRFEKLPAPERSQH